MGSSSSVIISDRPSAPCTAFAIIQNSDQLNMPCAYSQTFTKIEFDSNNIIACRLLQDYDAAN
jgi:hypothetical protein